MRRGRGTIVLAAVTLTLSAGGGARAATADEIYRDLTDNGRLDHRYSNSDLQSALARPPASVGASGTRTVASYRAPAAASSAGGRGPVTGLDFALLAVSAAPLLLVGVRRRHRRLAAIAAESDSLTAA